MIDMVKKEIRNFIVETFLFGQGGDELSDDDSLLENEVFDSNGVLEFVLYLEETFDIEISDEELLPDNLDSINRLVEFLKSKGVA